MGQLVWICWCGSVGAGLLVWICWCESAGVVFWCVSVGKVKKIWKTTYLQRDSVRHGYGLPIDKYFLKQ